MYLCWWSLLIVRTFVQLSALFPVHCADDGTASPHQRNAIIAVTTFVRKVLEGQEKPYIIYSFVIQFLKVTQTGVKSASLGYNCFRHLLIQLVASSEVIVIKERVTQCNGGSHGSLCYIRCATQTRQQDTFIVHSWDLLTVTKLCVSKLWFISLSLP